jgi:cell division protein ZipA
VNELRWILLIAGIIVLAIIYVIGRKEQLRRRSRWQEEAGLDEETDVSLDTRWEHDDIAPEPDRFNELEDLLQEDASVHARREVSTDAAPVIAIPPATRPEQKLKRLKPRSAERPSAGNDMIVSLYVVARRPGTLRGEAIRVAADRLNLEYGDMQIFNRVIERNGRRHILFSMANAVKPGTFDIESLQGVITPGLALFMQLPGPLEGLKSFNAMLDCAQRLAGELDAELQDETHSALTNQTIDHMREEIQLFSLRTARTRDRAP